MKMKATLKIVVLTFLVIATSSHCYALRLLSAVSTESEAQELGVKITSEILGTNNIGVWLEFSPHGKLEHFHHGELEVVSSGGRQLVHATLLPLQQTKEKVVLYFSAAADYVGMSTLTLIVSGASKEAFAGYSFPISRFVPMPPNKSVQPTPTH